MEKKFEVLPPSMPNFVRFKKEAAGLRQDGYLYTLLYTVKMCVGKKLKLLFDI
jgi:hypothetical protein